MIWVDKRCTKDTPHLSIKSKEGRRDGLVSNGACCANLMTQVRSLGPTYRWEEKTKLHRADLWLPHALGHIVKQRNNRKQNIPIRTAKSKQAQQF